MSLYRTSSENTTTLKDSALLEASQHTEVVPRGALVAEDFALRERVL